MALEAAEMKKIVAEKAVDTYVKDKMNVGLGTGSTAYYAIKRIGQLVNENGYDLTCVATSVQSENLARECGIRVVDIDEVDKLDVTIDGADEIDPKMNLIKGSEAPSSGRRSSPLPPFRRSSSRTAPRSWRSSAPRPLSRSRSSGSVTSTPRTPSGCSAATPSSG